MWVVTNQYYTLWSLADVAIIFHLTGSGSPHPSLLKWVSVNHCHAVALRLDREISQQSNEQTPNMHVDRGV